MRLGIKPFVHRLGDGLFLYDPITDRAVVLNATARTVWEFLNEGFTEAAIASAFTRHFGISQTHAAQDVHQIVAELAVLASAASQADSEVAVPLHATIASACDSRQSASMQDCGVFHFGNSSVSVRSNIKDMGADYFSRFRNRSASDDLRPDSLEISIGPASYRLTFRGELVSDVDTLAELSADVNELLLRLEHPDTRFLAYFHAAAVSLDGHSVLISGVSGAGKSTLAAYLTGHGFFYLGDDLIAMTDADRTLRALPTCLSLKAGSWPILTNLYPDLAVAPTVYCHGRAVRYAEPPRIDATMNAAAAPSAIVFPRYRQGEPTRLSACTPLQTMVCLIQASVDLAKPVDEERLSKFIGVVERTPAYELTYSHLPSAMNAIAGLVDGTR